MQRAASRPSIVGISTSMMTTSSYSLEPLQPVDGDVGPVAQLLDQPECELLVDRVVLPKRNPISEALSQHVRRARGAHDGAKPT
jgi:hypothetical protein